jgi:hypothetical protein
VEQRARGNARVAGTNSRGGRSPLFLLFLAAFVAGTAIWVGANLRTAARRLSLLRQGETAPIDALETELTGRDVSDRDEYRFSYRYSDAAGRIRSGSATGFFASAPEAASSGIVFYGPDDSAGDLPLAALGLDRHLEFGENGELRVRGLWALGAWNLGIALAMLLVLAGVAWSFLG